MEQTQRNSSAFTANSYINLWRKKQYLQTSQINEWSFPLFYQCSEWFALLKSTSFVVVILINYRNEHKDNLKTQILPWICSQDKRSFCDCFIVGASLPPFYSTFVACFITETLPMVSQLFSGIAGIWEISNMSHIT